RGWPSRCSLCCSGPRSPVTPGCCAALCDADAEASLQRGVQPILVVGLESVCRPGDVTVGTDQQRAGLDVRGGTVHDIDAVCPSACGFADLSAGKIKQYRAAP